MSDDIREEDFEEAVAKYFPKCPLCGSQSLEIDIEFGRRYDHVICRDCDATWEIDWKGEGIEIESIELVGVRDAERAGLKDGKHKPEFWQSMALHAEEAQPITKEKNLIKEKEEKRINAQVKEKQETSFCPSCGKDISWLRADATNCPYCGSKLKTTV
jgi:Zn finger protein HypA/HybF involved in hydrogenase expression